VEGGGPFSSKLNIILRPILLSNSRGMWGKLLSSVICQITVVAASVCCLTSCGRLSSRWKVDNHYSTEREQNYNACVNKRRGRRYFCKRWTPRGNDGIDFEQGQFEVSELTKYNGANFTVWFVGDSMFNLYWEATQCLFPEVSVNFVWAKGISLPIAQALRSMRKKIQRNDVVLLNSGAWYPSHKKDAFIRDMKTLGKVLLNFNHPNIIWVRTSAQHFCGNGGGAFPVGKKKVKKCCRFTFSQVVKANYQWPIVLKYVKPAKIIDLFTPSVELWSAHPGNGDCTHWCTNYLGYPTYAALEILLALQPQSQRCKAKNNATA